MVSIEEINGFAYIVDSERNYKVLKSRTEGQILGVKCPHASFLFTEGLDKKGLYDDNTVLIERGSAVKFLRNGDLHVVCESYFMLTANREDCFYPTISELKQYLNLKYGI